MRKILSDNKSRRSDVERRKIFYTMHIPEHRSGKERRNEKDRRPKQKKSE